MTSNARSRRSSATGRGSSPKGAYLDAIQMHAISTMEEVDTLYLGMAERGSKMPDRIGAFPALLDYRDGDKLTPA